MKKFFVLVAFTFWFTLGIDAQAPVAEKVISKTEQLQSLMDHCDQNGLFNGSILVADKGKVIFRDAFGYSDKENEEMLTSESAFYLASVSKQFTTMAIMILKEQGKLTYDDPLSKYFPEFPPYADHVLIRHMMTHTSGIPDHYRLNIYKPKLNNNDVLKRLVKQDSLDFSPGERYSYSNGGYVLLSMIVSKVAGVPFSQFMHENIFEPLEMDRTLVYDESEPEVLKRAKGHNEYGGLDDYEILTTGAGGMFSTVDDLLKWDRALYTEKLVSRETMQEAYLSTKLNSGEFSDYGYGWGIQEEDGQKVVSHSGGMNGYRTFIRRDLSNDQVHIILTNFGNKVAMGQINTAVSNILQGESFEFPRKRTSSLLAEVMDNHDPEKAISLVKVKLEKDSSSFEHDEMGINALGYRYINENQYEQAKAVFQFNIDQFPSSSNTYDSMGEVYMLSGDTAKSVALYKKSIELNPNNTNGFNMLERMGVDTEELRPKVVVPDDLLDTYVGKYELNPGFVLTILREGSKLMIHPTGQQVSEIFPATQRRFYSKIVDAQITFNINADGVVESLTLHQGGDYVAKRIE